MCDKILLNQIQIQEGAFPKWENLEDYQWEGTLKNYFFLNSNRFGFNDVESKEDLFPIGLTYFKDWDINEIDLIEVHNELICQFELNELCKKKLLNRDFTVHQKNFSPPRSYQDYDEDHFYYEFDVIYFFKDLELIGFYVNHEQEIIFKCQKEFKLLENLDKSIKEFIIDAEEFDNAFNSIYKTKNSDKEN